jgi:molybdopterin/thiamine biosynthesis adenylyltransferase
MWDRVERLIGRPNLERLAAMRVAVVGLGSGGGFAALSLAMSGVGRFVLIDDDTLEDANIVRHVADRRAVGQPKAQALADLIAQRNPHAVCTVVVGRIEAHLNMLDEVDLVVSGLDTEPGKYTLNAACLERGLDAVYAGVYARGEGGDVVVIEHDGDGPCYACWAGEVRVGAAAADDGDTAQTAAPQPGAADAFAAESGLDYGMVGADGTLEAEPGLWLHVVRIASAQADLALNLLLRGTPAARAMPGNTVIMANHALEILEGETTPPFGAVWLDIARDPHCLVCGPVRARARGSAEAAARLSLDELLAQPFPHRSADTETDTLAHTTGYTEEKS